MAAVAEELSQAARSLIEREMARADVRSDALGKGWSKDLWVATAVAGWSDVLLEEEHGGLGLGLEAAAGLFSVVGRYLVPGPYLDQVVMVPTIYACAPTPVQSRLDRARAGDEIVVLADPAAAGGGVVLSGGSLTGKVSLVRHCAIADGLVVIAGDPAGGAAMVFVDASDPGVSVAPRDSFDPASVVADVSFDHVAIPRDHVLLPPEGVPVIDRLRATMRLMIAAELTGLARHLLEASVGYAKTREQFGRPIGSFQAVQQILAEMAVQVLGAEAFTADCAARAELDPLDAVVVKGFTSQVARQVGESALQVHGGIAFTEEFEDNRWFLHALTLQGLYGDEAVSFRDAGRALLTHGRRA